MDSAVAAPADLDGGRPLRGTRLVPPTSRAELWEEKVTKNPTNTKKRTAASAIPLTTDDNPLAPALKKARAPKGSKKKKDKVSILRFLYQSY